MLTGPPPIVKSLDDFDRLLGQLGRVRANEREDQAEFDRETQAIKDRIIERQLVEVGGETLTYADYRAKVEAALHAFAVEHKTHLLDGVEGQTRRFAHGTVSYRALAPCLEDVDGDPKTTAAKLLAKVKSVGKDGLAAAVVTWLSGVALKGTKKATAADVFRVKVEVDRAAIFKLMKAKTLTAKWLACVNLKLATDRFAVDIDPSEELVKSEQTAPVEPAKRAA